MVTCRTPRDQVAAADSAAGACAPWKAAMNTSEAATSAAPRTKIQNLESGRFIQWLLGRPHFPAIPAWRRAKRIMPLRAGFLSNAELRRQGNTCDRSARKLTFDCSCLYLGTTKSARGAPLHLVLFCRLTKASFFAR